MQSYWLRSTLCLPYIPTPCTDTKLCPSYPYRHASINTNCQVMSGDCKQLYLRLSCIPSRNIAVFTNGCSITGDSNVALHTYSFLLDGTNCSLTHVLLPVTTGSATIELAENLSPLGPYHFTVRLEESPCTVFIAQQFKLRF